MLEKEYNYFKKNKEKLIKEYPNKYVVIKAEKIIGVYDNENKAIEETLKDHKLGTFLVQKCSENSDQVMRFHSRVIFSQYA